jgi:hypothetical protein
MNMKMQSRAKECPSLDPIVSQLNPIHTIQYNSVALVRQRTMPTEWPPLVGEVSANFCG